MHICMCVCACICKIMLKSACKSKCDMTYKSNGKKKHKCHARRGRGGEVDRPREARWDFVMLTLRLLES